jgi:hypothetical protein
MLKHLLSIAAIAAISLSAKAAEPLQLSGGWNTNLQLVDVKMTATSGWGEYKLATNISRTDYKGYRVEYADATAGGWQIKITGPTNIEQYNDISATETSISNDFKSDFTTIDLLEIQSKAANNVITIKKVFLIKQDGTEEQVTLGSPNWGINLSSTNNFAPSLVFVGQWGTATVLDEKGENVTYTKGGAEQKYEIKFAEATPISLIVEFDNDNRTGDNKGVAYWNIPAATTSATYTLNDDILGDDEGITSVYVKADDNATNNNLVKFESITVTKSNAGVGNVAVDESAAPVEYFNLQGVRVANPQNGLYIRRQGTKATKVLVK